MVDFPIDSKMWSVIIITQPVRNQKGIDKTKCCISFKFAFCPTILLTKQLLIDWITFAPLWFAKTGKLLHEFHWIMVGSNWYLVYTCGSLSNCFAIGLGVLTVI